MDLTVAVAALVDSHLHVILRVQVRGKAVFGNLDLFTLLTLPPETVPFGMRGSRTDFFVGRSPKIKKR